MLCHCQLGQGDLRMQLPPRTQLSLKGPVKQTQNQSYTYTIG